MKTYVITLSQNFPAKHPRKGQPTGFADKVQEALNYVKYHGIEGMRGALSDWLVITERDDDWHILGVQAVRVDGEKIKADTWYKLVNGKITECE